MRSWSSKRNARVYGRPPRYGAARRRLAAYRATALWVIGACWLAVIAVASSVASSNGVSGWGTAGTLLLLAGVIHAAVHRPELTATLLTLVVFAPVWVRVAVLYSVSATGSASLGTTWFVFAALAGGTAAVAHQTSRGRPWVTVLCAMGAVTVLGPLTLILWPRGGFLVASGYAALVLLVRSKAWPLLVDNTIDSVRDTRSAWSSVNDPDGTDWERGAEGEQRTAATLSDLPTGFNVFHNRAVKNATENVDHLVIGPTGVWVLTSRLLTGQIDTDPNLGLMLNGATMIGALTEAINRSDQVARALGLRRADVTTVYVVHGAPLGAPRQVVKVLNGADVFLGSVVVLSPEGVLEEIDNPLETHSARQVNGLRRRAARKLSAFNAPFIPLTAAVPATPRPVGEPVDAPLDDRA